MKKSFLIGVIVIVVVVVAAGAWSWYTWNQQQVNQPSTNPPMSLLNKSISDGTVTVGYPSKDFGLAVGQMQILIKSTIPPCTAGFQYCYYYDTADYSGTNFESAGVRQQKRADLKTQTACLNTPPAGFTVTPDATANGNGYFVSEFSNVGQGAAGSLSAGSLYRLFIPASNSCYEFETRIAESDIGNYPSGSVKTFTTADQANVATELLEILNSVKITSGQTNLFSQLIPKQS